VRVEIMGSPKCRIVGDSQSVLIMIDPMISTRTRRRARTACLTGDLGGLGPADRQGSLVGAERLELVAPLMTMR
jgi:hypothetical protein